MQELRKILFRALEKSDLNMLRAMLAQGLSAKLEFGDRMPPLMEAINCGRCDFEILEELKAAGADIREPEPCQQQTYLHWAVWQGREDILKWGLGNGADVNAQDKNGKTPLFNAVAMAAQYDPDLTYQESALLNAALLLEAGADVAIADNMGKTALHYAAGLGSVQAVSLLVEHNAVIDARDGDSQTPLMLATRKGHDDIVSLLLANGADANASDSNKKTALHHIAGINPDALTPNYLVITKALLEAGADVNISDEHGFPPLYDCAGNNNIEIAKLLLTYGADPNRSSGAVLHDAVFFEHNEIVTLLLSAGAKAGQSHGETQNTALHLAALENYSFGIAALLDNGAPIDAIDIDGETPLMVAVRREHSDIVRILLERGADRYLADHYNNTPLSLAVRRGNTELIAMLRNQAT